VEDGEVKLKRERQEGEKVGGRKVLTRYGEELEGL
jgi:hypothetical protein